MLVTMWVSESRLASALLLYLCLVAHCVHGACVRAHSASCQPLSILILVNALATDTTNSKICWDVEPIFYYRDPPFPVRPPSQLWHHPEPVPFHGQPVLLTSPPATPMTPITPHPPPVYPMSAQFNPTTTAQCTLPADKWVITAVSTDKLSPLLSHMVACIGKEALFGIWVMQTVLNKPWDCQLLADLARML